MRKPVFGHFDQVWHKPIWKSWKKARCLKFWLLVEEELHYSSSKNEGADQLHNYCEADLRLCFRIGKNLVFSRCDSYVIGALIKVKVILKKEKMP